MGSSHEVDITAEDSRLHVVRGDHVVRHKQELFSADPFVMFGDDRCKLWYPSRDRIALQDQVQNGHEVTFATAEASVEVTRLASVCLYGATNKTQCVVEAKF